MNELTIVALSADVDETEGYDIREVVERAAAVKSARDYISFLKELPSSFFAQYIGQPLDHEEMTKDLDNRDGTVYGKRISDVLDKYYPDIEYLDRAVAVSGDLGEAFEREHASPDRGTHVVEYVRIDPRYKIGCHQIQLDMAMNARMLLSYAAVANGERWGKAHSPIKRMDCLASESAVLVDSGIAAYQAFNKSPIQTPHYSEYFGDAECRRLEGAAASVLGKVDGKHLTTHDLTAAFLLPGDWSDRDIAANIFTSFMNTLFEDTDMSGCIGNAFKVRFDEGGFAVAENRNPVQEFYYQIAKIAEDKSVGLCPVCGSPVLRGRSRGNSALLCSKSCKTTASKERREDAIKYAASGMPVDDAIALIGERYEASVRKWYEEVLGTDPAR